MLADHLIHLLQPHHLPQNSEKTVFPELLRELCSAMDSGSSCLPITHTPHSEEDALSALNCDATDSAVGSPGKQQPLILTATNKLYLQRYFLYEQEIADSISLRLKLPTTPPPADFDKQLAEIFGEITANAQCSAAKTAFTRHFSIISGGPGTGKTTTVVKILRLLKQNNIITSPKDVLLLAPTGKAADRLKQSIASALARENLPAEDFPTDASTIHRALGYKHGSIDFKHNTHSPLQAELIVIDEASMIDLPLMAKLLRAIPHETRLILLGDKNQLTSVEVGSVLSDLIQAAQDKTKPLHSHVTILDKSYRNIGDIHLACEAIKQGDAENSLRIMNQSDSQSEGGILNQATPSTLYPALEPLVEKHWLPCITNTNIPTDEKMRAIDSFRILSPTHRGPLGIDVINRTVERILSKHGIDIDSRWYPGRSVIVQENDYSLGIFNGDTGLCVEKDGEIFVAFSSAGETRYITPTVLPKVKTAWALTIHRTQGSEYSHLLLIIPPAQETSDSNTHTSRELLYTGLSRAKQSATIWSTPETLTTAIHHPAQRASGLTDHL